MSNICVIMSKSVSLQSKNKFQVLANKEKVKTPASTGDEVM
jgi:hypothetical protein